MDIKKKEYLSVVGLIFVAIFWGLGFPALKSLSDVMPAFWIIALRFLIASLILALVFHRKLHSINRHLALNALILSIFLFFTYVFATVGIRYTTSAKASFFCCISVLIIPVITRMLFKTKITRKVAISILVCTAGLFLISYSADMGWSLASGDIICLGCSLFAALHVVFTGMLASKLDVALLTIVQLFFISVFAGTAGIFIEKFPHQLAAPDILVLIFLGLFCTAAAFLIQTASQRFVSSARVGVIFAIEPVSGALFSMLLLGDRLGFHGLLGGLLIIMSIIIMESKLLNRP